MPTLALRRIIESERDELRAAADRYWAELMPHAAVIRDPERRAGYFEDCFRFHGATSLLWWAIAEDAKVGFAKVDLWENHDGPGADIRDFYIEAPWRRQGYGRVFVRRIVQELRMQGDHRIDLTVRCDNPVALTFWRSLGFDLSLYHLRMYLDP
jgi:GNAT superfamily N-acetyltransferase